jgi:dUTP pyrophosphatase
MLIDFIPMYPDAKVPVRATEGAVGYDVHAYHVVHKTKKDAEGNRLVVQELPFVLEPGKSVLIGIGIKCAVPFPYDCEVRPRSGLATVHEVGLGNAPGTIDPDYRGEAGVLLRNFNDTPYTIDKGDRIAQLLFKKVEIVDFRRVEVLPPTHRASGGFGSTGTGGDPQGDAVRLAEQLKWDRYWLRQAFHAASLSNCLRGAERDAQGKFKKDEENRYVGACRRYGCFIVRLPQEVVSSGFNRQNFECHEEIGCARERLKIPSGSSNDVGCWHAEEDAFQNATIAGISPVGATLYVNSQPCHKCAKEIIGKRIGAVVVPSEIVYPDHSCRDIEAAGIEVRWVDPLLHKYALAVTVQK